ncbi:TonB-dependent receptor domain-containing protein [Caulobacter segnis]
MGLTSWNHELRMTGSLFEDKVNWTGGVYLEKRGRTTSRARWPWATRATGVINPNDLTAWRHVGTDTKQIRLLRRSVLQADRQADPDRRRAPLQVRQDRLRPGPDQQLHHPVLRRAEAAQVDASADGWVSKLNASYQVTSDVMVYAGGGQGLPSGRRQQRAEAWPARCWPISPTACGTTKAASRAQWFDRRLTLNAAVYQIDWSNMQISATSANGAFSYLTNAGKEAKIKGFEVEAVARPIRGPTISGTAAVVDAKLTEDQANSTILITGSTGLRGARVPERGQVQRLGLGRIYLAAEGDLNGLLRADYAYVGESASQFRPTYVYYEKQGDYGYANLRAGVEGGDWATPTCSSTTSPMKSG